MCRLCIVFTRSPRTVQHKQPLLSKIVSSLDLTTKASSIPTSPNSLIITATFSISLLVRSFESNVVFPLPKKPVRIDTGVLSWVVSLVIDPLSSISPHAEILRTIPTWVSFFCEAR